MRKKLSEKKKVFVGLSGGVDSAVSAALLKQQGYDVTGVFIKAWTPPGYVCSWKEDRRSAMRAAAVLDIPFFTLDLEKEYKKEVVDYMIEEYKKGRTPNPDVMCNREIKFGYFLKFALEEGADFVATGHYARTATSPRPSSTKLSKGAAPLHNYGEGVGGEVVLLEGKDKNKDQSYFLWTLGQEQLKHVLFPIGNLQKSGVRKLAERFGLPQAIRKDSQGVCFLGQIDMKGFLKEFVGSKKGKVLDENGAEVGEHEGALLYTIGERHGFAVTQKTDKSIPLYIIAKDIAKNTITVAPKKIAESKSTAAKEIVLSDFNLISPVSFERSGVSCRIRYRGEKIPCEIILPKEHSNILKNVGISVKLETPQMGISPGQSLVFYLAAQAGQDEICLGGGIIDSTSPL